LGTVSQTKLASFQRQLNLYGFSRCRDQKRSGGDGHTKRYSHPMFVRGQKELVQQMRRCKIKGTGPKRQQDNHAGTSRIVQEPRLINDEESTHCVASLVISQDPPICIVPESPSSFGNSLAQGQQVEDGDLLFFEGSPFHFLDSRSVVELPLNIKPELLFPTSIETSFRPLTPRSTVTRCPLLKPAFQEVKNIASV